MSEGETSPGLLGRLQIRPKQLDVIRKSRCCFQVEDRGLLTSCFLNGVSLAFGNGQTRNNIISSDDVQSFISNQPADFLHWIDANRKHSSSS